MMRVWHPDLSPAERASLQFVFDALDDPALVEGAGGAAEASARSSGAAPRVRISHLVTAQIPHATRP